MAVNSRSNDVSVFAVTSNGLRLVDRTPSGGNFPVSIAHHDNLVYVLNEGESPDESFGGIPNMTGFHLDQAGKMHKIPDSTRITGSPDSAPSEIAFSPDGEILIVTEMTTNLIGVYHMRANGRTGELVRLPANNPTPLAVSFGRHGLVAITEGNDIGHRIGLLNGASLSTYRITDDDNLEPVSKAVTVNKTGTCWVRFSPDGRFAFTGDTGSGTVSTFGVARNGEITLLGAADTGGLASVPIDLDVTPDGKFLYVLASFPGEVKGFRIQEDGSLMPIGGAGGMPFTIQGIVAR
jgi:6-phosphogluconolactonase (cycloisomerase 2 family)